MDNDENIRFKVEDLLCSYECKTFHKFNNGKMETWGYSIKRNRQGVEISRSEPICVGRLGWSDGSDFTKNDYNKFSGEHG